jgi:phage tail sheath protein FI
VTQTSRTLSQNQLDVLNSSSTPVNVIRRVSSTGICIMGGRTLDQRMADRYVGIRRSLSYIHRRLKDLTEFALFENNGPDLWEEVNIRLSNFLGLYYQQGALRGAREPEAFYIVCDASNNTPTTIQNGELHVTVGVAVEYPAEFVIIKLTQSQGSVRVS